MKAHDLAKALLEQPNIDVFVQTSELDGEQRAYNANQLVDKFTITPDGLYIDHDKLISGNPPEYIPVIGSYFVYFKDGTITPSRLPNASKWAVPTVAYLSDGEVRVVEYGTYNMEHCSCYQQIRMGIEQDIILSTNDEHFDKLDKVFTDGKRVMRLCDVDHFSVLTSFNEENWNPTFTDMSYEEALAFGKTLRR